MVKILSLQDTIKYLRKDRRLRYKDISKLLGVSSDQVYKYGTGYTKSCNDNVLIAIYESIKYKDGERIVIDCFNSEKEFLEYLVYKNHIEKGKEDET